jgi:hypothetical protein
MTPWTVVNDENARNPERPAEKHGTPRWVKAALVSLLAILVVGTGSVLLPAREEPAAGPPFSETAKAAAYAETRALMDAASATGSPPATLTLLETQARALLAPSAVTSPVSSSPVSSGSAAAPTRAVFVSGLGRSAAQRLADAGKSDGGTARLLAAVGTAQLLESTRLAAAWGLPAPARPALPASAGLSSPAASCPAGGETASAPADEAESSDAESPDAAAPGAGDALAAVVRAEQKAVYIYQVALTRLDGTAAATAARDLASHQDLLREAETLARQRCTEPPPREAGYRLPAGFASQAAAALGEQESAALPAYAELVALADGGTRAWAMAGLLDGARRMQSWGTVPGALPGLAVDPAGLPELPETATPSAS